MSSKPSEKFLKTVLIDIWQVLETGGYIDCDYNEDSVEENIKKLFTDLKTDKPNDLKLLYKYFSDRPEKSLIELAKQLSYYYNYDGPDYSYCIPELVQGVLMDSREKWIKNEKNEQGSSENTGEKGMLKKLVGAVKDDVTEVAIRHSAKQLTKSFQEPIVAFLISRLGLENNLESKGKLISLLNDDIGFGLISFALSFGVGSLPLPEAIKPHLERLTNELRIQGEMVVSEPMVEMLAAPMRMMLTEKVLALPLLQTTEMKQLATATVVETKLEEIKEVAPKKKPSKKNKIEVKIKSNTPSK